VTVVTVLVLVAGVWFGVALLVAIPVGRMFARHNTSGRGSGGAPTGTHSTQN
jgi:hypothetical protein